MNFFSPLTAIVKKFNFVDFFYTSRNNCTIPRTIKHGPRTHSSVEGNFFKGHRSRSRPLQSSLSLARPNGLTVSLSYACNTSFESPLQGLSYFGLHAPPCCIHFEVIRGNMRNGTVFTQFFAYGFEVVRDKCHKPYIF